MIRQLQPIQWGQINDGDAFCIDAVDFIFVWNGKLANRLEKLQAAKVSLGSIHYTALWREAFKKYQYSYFNNYLTANMVAYVHSIQLTKKIRKIREKTGFFGPDF